MMSSLSPIYFYLPPEDYPEVIPKDADHYWVNFRKGIYCWTLQTYLHLKNQGFPCQLVNTLPEAGIILAHYDSLPQQLMPTDQQLIVCFQADRARHLYAQIHIVQNREGLRRDLMTWGDRYLLAGLDYYMPHWPQPGLIPRSTDRGDQFTNLGFFGLECNLLPEFLASTWHKKLAKMDIRWQVISEFSQWNDYSQIDGVLAVRSFEQKGFQWKPATKLFNAWHAGVPAILGYESAYQAERKNELDYLEVRFLEETLEAIQRLKNDAELRKAMVRNGQYRAGETSTEQLTQRWHQFIQVDLSSYYHLWTSSSAYRQTYKARREIAINSREQRKSLQSYRNQISVKGTFKKYLSYFT
jgi:hypothetical protein